MVLPVLRLQTLLCNHINAKYRVVKRTRLTFLTKSLNPSTHVPYPPLVHRRLQVLSDADGVWRPSEAETGRGHAWVSLPRGFMAWTMAEMMTTTVTTAVTMRMTQPTSRSESEVDPGWTVRHGRKRSSHTLYACTGCSKRITINLEEVYFRTFLADPIGSGHILKLAYELFIWYLLMSLELDRYNHPSQLKMSPAFVDMDTKFISFSRTSISSPPQPDLNQLFWWSRNMLPVHFSRS